MSDIEKQPLDFPCPGCNKKLKATIGDVKRNKTVRCSGCGADISLSADPSLKRTVDKLVKDLKSLGFR
jgi:hypothetical protein